ncbi:hypothetical protein [Listeria booriae]|uniref:hypothetical protein n=1 Tax=Listeria booriae TaxID=1552123 RepID=UPI001627AE2E|nr:hypothetical protein [Listeria booriae]MBC2303360.1 hypothetical protein [Listeria booriae]
MKFVGKVIRESYGTREDFEEIFEEMGVKEFEKVVKELKVFAGNVGMVQAGTTFDIYKFVSKNTGGTRYMAATISVAGDAAYNEYLIFEASDIDDEDELITFIQDNIDNE